MPPPLRCLTSLARPAPFSSILKRTLVTGSHDEWVRAYARTIQEDNEKTRQIELFRLGLPRPPGLFLEDLWKNIQATLGELAFSNVVGSPYDDLSKTQPFKYYIRRLVDMLSKNAGLEEPAYGHMEPSGAISNYHAITSYYNLLATPEGPTPLVYLSEHAHFAICKVLDHHQIPYVRIATDANGAMNLADLTHHLDHDHPAIVVATLGTTDLDANDPLLQIRKILESKYRPGEFYIHADAARNGIIAPLLGLPILSPIGAHSMSLSAHKHGTLGMGSLLITSRRLADMFAEQRERTETDPSQCLGLSQKSDSTAFCSIDGRASVELFSILTLLGAHLSGPDNLLLQHHLKSIEVAAEFAKEMGTIVGAQNVLWIPGQQNVLFPPPPPDIISKFSLSKSSEIKGSTWTRACFLFGSDYPKCSTVREEFWEVYKKAAEQRLLRSKI